ncbi:MAG: ABC transporter permease [Candidatus Eisenbacteria bacterium]|uniref:ABC transporter permease n=1 Tax=Eiseniibacteriota bacterium TaxID=2212470 RepID=A0A849SZG4_UNCEI|nr:ABC transporter permease [Candidatus Eisenbacteria bacterium]
MKLDWKRVKTVARREFLTTIKRRAFLFMLIATPAFYALIMMGSSGVAISESRKAIREFKALGVVDSSGRLAGSERSIKSALSPEDLPASRSGTRSAPAPVMPSDTEVRFYATQAEGEAALRSKDISQLMVVPSDYLENGGLRRYATSNSPFTTSVGRSVGRWLSASLIRGQVDSTLAARAARPMEREQYLTLDRDGRFVIEDERRELLNVFMPMAFAMLLGMCVIIGGQYLLQGVSEEKESRILESLLCSVSPDELIVGKLLGLGSVGLMVVTIWASAGLAFAAPMLAAAKFSLPPWLLGVAIAYFIAGYLFFGSLMIGIGAITNNMREAQQFSVWISFANFAPMIVLWAILSRPDGPLAMTLSMLPPTAATTMMMRLTAPGASVPWWQIAISLTLLASSAWLALRMSSRLFRVGMLLYGKTPTLPEIMRWVRQG